MSRCVESVRRGEERRAEEREKGTIMDEWATLRKQTFLSTITNSNQ